MHSPEEMLEYASELAVRKVEKPLFSKIILAFIGGAMVSLGYLTYLRVAATIPGGAGTLAGAALFPAGLIAIVLGGSELATSNIMVVSFGYLQKKVRLSDLLKNWLTITLANILGAIFVAAAFGIGAGALTAEPYLTEALHVADGKVAADFMTALWSGIGCNWLVGMACWLAYGAREAVGKILAIWFPITIFIVLGFQHSVANSFVIPFAILEGHLSWLDFAENFIPVYLGNIIGGSVLMALLYTRAYRH